MTISKNLQNLKKVNAHNTQSNKKYKLGINKFSDLTFNEFKSKYLQTPRKAQKNTDLRKVEVSLPTEVDWRTKKGAVNPVKDQGQCGSCWAFSTVASVENLIWRTKNKSVSLSEQELVDCAGGKYENEGCNGGLMDKAMDYVVDNKIGTERSYPYKAVDHRCNKKNKKKKGRVAVSGYNYISPSNVNGLQKAVAEGVVSVSIEVQDDFQMYESGVYESEDEDCGEYLNHGVAAVGYKSDGDSPYFIVRNSWGEDWGEEGYIRVAWGSESGTCGLADKDDLVPTA